MTTRRSVDESSSVSKSSRHQKSRRRVSAGLHAAAEVPSFEAPPEEEMKNLGVDVGDHSLEGAATDDFRTFSRRPRRHDEEEVLRRIAAAAHSLVASAVGLLREGGQAAVAKAAVRRELELTRSVAVRRRKRSSSIDVSCWSPALSHTRVIDNPVITELITET